MNKKMKDHPSNIYSRIDFDDEDQYIEFFAVEKNNIVKIIQYIAKFYPKESLEYGIKNILNILSRKSIEKGEDMNNVLKTSTVHSVTYILWDGATNLFEKIIQGSHLSKDYQNKFKKVEIELYKNLIEELLKVKFIKS
jgi:hypothetical protein